MFVPAGHDLTFGEMDPAEKHRDQPPRGRVPQAGGGACCEWAPCTIQASFPRKRESSREPGRSWIPSLRRETTGLALYVHWPFCVSKCPYCDFNSHVRESVDQAAWREALLEDLAWEAEAFPGRRLASIFFGGGTPSLMEPATVAALIEAAERHWGLAPDVEITLEANPSSVEAARFADLAAAGVNRVSLGLQSLDDQALRFLGRAHDAAEGLAALATAQRCFDRVSFDLIYALPGQSEAAWAAELEPGARLRHRPSLALPADDRARHALRRHGRARRAGGARSRRGGARSTS